MPLRRSGPSEGVGLRALSAYFLRLGTSGFGGPVALVGFMHRDLVERRKWISEETYALGLALAQIMPGPLAAQVAIALGYFTRGVVGATLVGLSFVLPSFLMVLGISLLYVTYGGLWWMQAAFYAIGASVIAIIAIAAVKLSRTTNRRDPLLWGIFAVLVAVTLWSQAELAEFFIAAGLLVYIVRAWPGWRSGVVVVIFALMAAAAVWLIGQLLARDVMRDTVGEEPLTQILLFFVQAGAFVFGSGLAIIPFLYQGAVEQLGWLSEQQFVDAVAVAMITPGPVVITVSFIGYLVAGFGGALVAAIGIFLPVYVFTIVPAPWFSRHRDNAQLRAFVQGATAAATGAITGAVILLAQRSIFDVPTAVIALASLVILWRFRLPEPVLVLASGAVGLAIWPYVSP